MNDLLPVPIEDIAKASGFPSASRALPPQVVIPYDPAHPETPTNNLARVRGTPNTRVEPTPFENLLRMLVGPETPRPAGFIGVRG